MRKLHNPRYDVADNLLAAFAGCGYLLHPGDKLLDFGCGDGKLVLRFRQLGLDAYGFDIHNRLEGNSQLNANYFQFLQSGNASISDTTFNPNTYSLPFPNNTFDVVVSLSVLEHVTHIDVVFREIARVLKPDGFAYHLYPKKSVFIEPHLYIPFASRFQAWWYFYLWASLGVRNEFQTHMSPREVADSNVSYCQHGLRYYSKQELFHRSSNYFSVVKEVDDLYYPGIARSTFYRNKLHALRSSHVFKALSQTLKMGSLLMAQKIPR